MLPSNSLCSQTVRVDCLCQVVNQNGDGGEGDKEFLKEKEREEQTSHLTGQFGKR